MELSPEVEAELMEIGDAHASRMDAMRAAYSLGQQAKKDEVARLTKERAKIEKGEHPKYVTWEAFNRKQLAAEQYASQVQEYRTEIVRAKFVSRRGSNAVTSSESISGRVRSRICGCE